MTNYLLSIDPGWSTGIALLSYEDDSPAVLVKAWQFSGGLTALRDWVARHWFESDWDYYNDAPQYAHLVLRDPYLSLYTESRENYWDDENPEISPDLKVIAEKFTPRPNEKFGLTLRSVEPLRCEGVLVDRGLLPDYDPKVKEWRQPALQYLAGGRDKADKKKRLHRFLKESGYYVTGSQIDAPDADDARSAIGHGISYLIREGKHKPTFQVLSDWSAREGS